PEYLMLPAAKSLSGAPGPLVGQTIDHLECYKVRSGKTTVPTVNVVDEFGTLAVAVKKPLRLCVPVDKNGEGIADPTATLMCYKAKQTSSPTFRGTEPVYVDDQFGAATIAVDHLRELCVPSTVSCGVPGT